MISDPIPLYIHTQPHTASHTQNLNTLYVHVIAEDIQ